MQAEILQKVLILSKTIWTHLKKIVRRIKGEFYKYFEVVNMKIVNGKEKEYKDWYDKNSDPYSRACFTYAERWAEMLEELIKESDDSPFKVIVDNAERLSNEADTEGITGFMYGCAISILSQSWEYGEWLRKWHNKEYNYDGDGVVNPAIMTIG